MTPAQERVLEALRKVTSDGWPATIRDVQAEAGLASASTAYSHLQALEAQGLVETNPTRRIGWRLTPAGERKPTPALS